MATFISLPLEIREMVYSLLLVYDNPIPIASPCPKHKCPDGTYSECNLPSVTRQIKIDLPKDFANLSRASKQINTEASLVFYSRNAFLVANDLYHSPHFSNVHAIRVFKQRTPPEKMALIRRIEFGMVFSEPGPDFNDVHGISRALEKHFHGVESVGLTIAGSYYWYGRYRPPRTDAVQRIARSVKMLLKLGKLKEIRYYQEELLSKLLEFVEKTLKANYESGRVVEVILDPAKYERYQYSSPL